MDQGRVGVRGRMPAVWVLAHLGSLRCLNELFRIARSDPEPRVQAQTVPVLADLIDQQALHRLEQQLPGQALIGRRGHRCRAARPLRQLTGILLPA
jgi:hypothetical protein